MALRFLNDIMSNDGVPNEIMPIGISLNYIASNDVMCNAIN